jgi:mono/diheme cytochrome c family protein
MKRYALAVAVLLLSVGGGAIGQPGPGSTWGVMGPGIRANLVRQHLVMLYGIPAPYRSLIDPFPRTRAKLSRGAAVFQQSCAACHGLSGRGEGPERERLWPPPANLAWLAHTPTSRSDPYMYWTIAEGGPPVGSEMPAFKRTLSRRDIWSVIAYIREGLVPRNASVDGKRNPGRRAGR